MRPDWSVLVIDALAECKRRGVRDFDDAWAVATKRYPPRARDDGGFRPTLLPEPGEVESMREFLYRVCYEAWTGQRPALRHFSPLLLAGSDQSRIAHGKSSKVAA
jgi:hypothetical protein